MFKMGYEGKGLGKHAQGMIHPSLVEERPKKFGLGYVQCNGEDSKAMKACETTSRRTFVQILNHKHVKFVFQLNSIVLSLCCSKKTCVYMQLMVSMRVRIAMNT